MFSDWNHMLSALLRANLFRIKEIDEFLEAALAALSEGY